MVETISRIVPPLWEEICEEHWSCLGQMDGGTKKHEGLGFDDCLGSYQLCGATLNRWELKWS